jgi:hypothetical protein
MLKNQLSLLFLLGLFNALVSAQELSDNSQPPLDDIFSTIQDNSQGGTINLYQNPSINVLIDKSIRISEKEGLSGYRIQIFSGTGTPARDKAFGIKKEFLEVFPEINENLIYIDYQSPYFKVSIGDYRNRNEAFEYYHSIKKKFPGSYIVKSKINFPELELAERK